jgi:very-short-patch-repair endonuclease
MSTTRARELRNAMTEPEIMLWSRIRRLRAHGWHFRRQAPVGPYYLDFACLKLALVIEVDGAQHFDGPQAEKDRIRDAYLERRGFRILRLTNAAVRENLSGAADVILAQVLERAASMPLAPRQVTAFKPVE